MADVEFIDNSEAVLQILEKACDSAAEIIGGMWESNAKGLVAPKGPKGTPWPSDLATALRNSITHVVENGVLSVGSNLEVAPYVELGTGKFYDPPPQWLANHAKPKHGYGQAGIEEWIFYDELEQTFKVGVPMDACPYLRPAMMDHVDDYKKVVEGELKNA